MRLKVERVILKTPILDLVNVLRFCEFRVAPGIQGLI